MGERNAVKELLFRFWLGIFYTRAIDLNYFDAVGIFFAFLDAKPCWQSQSEVWPEV